MNKKYYRLFKGCIALIITVGVLYLGQAIWHNYAWDLPLDKALNDISGVEKVVWNGGNNVNDYISINVTLNNTQNLQKTYEEINTKIKQTLKDKRYTLEITDNRTLELEQAYYELHYYVQKSIMDGDFPLLEATVREKSEAAGMTAKVYVDLQNIYLQLSKDNTSLYAVTARNSNRIGGNY